MSEQERFEQSVAARLHPARFTKVGENPILGWNGAKDTDYVSHEMQLAWTTWQAATAQAVPEGYVVVKPALDSTAKYKMIGEYTFSMNDTDTLIPVPWSMIKQIYKGGIECMIQAAQEGE